MQKRFRFSAVYRNMRLLESISGFFLVSSLVVVGLFLLGNVQEFMDSTQLLLLTILRVSGLLCALTGVYYTISLVVWMFHRRRFLVVRFVYAIVATTVGAGLSLAVTFLGILLAPV